MIDFFSKDSALPSSSSEMALTKVGSCIATSSSSSMTGGSKNQMRRKLSKGLGKSVAATVPELVKILGGTTVIEKVNKNLNIVAFFIYCTCMFDRY